MRKARKKPHQMPKLSFIDQVVYWAGFLLLMDLYLWLVLAPMFLREKIAFSDESVIAVTENASALWAVLPCMTFLMITLIPWCLFYSDRRPIFGLKNFKYGPPAWPRVYPLFMKNKPYVWLSEKKQKKKKQILLLLIILLLVSFLFYPLSLFGRDCLMEDGSIRQYSMFNRVTAEILPQEVNSAEFSVYRHSAGKYVKTIYWDVQVALTTNDGTVYSFQAPDFRRAPQSEIPGWLTAMVHLAQQYDPARIRCSNAENLANVITGNDLTDAGVQLLYRLFRQDIA